MNKSKSQSYLKPFIFLSFLFLFGTARVFGQLIFDYSYLSLDTSNLRCTYSLTFAEDSTNTERTRTVDMYLFFGKNINLFISLNKFRSDTIMRKIKNSSQLQELMLDRNRPFPKILYTIYKNYPTGKLTFIEHTLDGTFKYEEELNKFNWQLTGDTATILPKSVGKAKNTAMAVPEIALASASVLYSFSAVNAVSNMMKN
ncbi:MAG: GLPGLI family protein [Bacteroidales bacterium]